MPQLLYCHCTAVGSGLKVYLMCVALLMPAYKLELALQCTDKELYELLQKKISAQHNVTTLVRSAADHCHLLAGCYFAILGPG